jgi:hypothetical protein
LVLLVGGTASKTEYIAEEAYTYEMTDRYRDGICYQYRAGKFKVTVNGESVAISSSGDFRDMVRESFVLVGRGTGFTVK